MKTEADGADQGQHAAVRNRDHHGAGVGNLEGSQHVVGAGLEPRIQGQVCAAAAHQVGHVPTVDESDRLGFDGGTLGSRNHRNRQQKTGDDDAEKRCHDDTVIHVG